MKTENEIQKTESKIGVKRPGLTGEEQDQIWVHEFDESAAQKLSKAVLKKADEDEGQPIVIYVDSYGGEVDGLASMLGVLDSVPNPVITIATGKAMSAGAILLSHGDVRCVGPHARVMIHEIRAGAWGNINDIKVFNDEAQRMNDYFVELLAKNCGKTSKQLKAMLRGDRRDMYLTPKQAVNFGIADHVGIPRIIIHQAFELKFLSPSPVKK